MDNASGCRSTKTVCVDPSHDIVSEEKVRTLDSAINLRKRGSQNDLLRRDLYWKTRMHGLHARSTKHVTNARFEKSRKRKY
jgi:hypothetical protein